MNVEITDDIEIEERKPELSEIPIINPDNYDNDVESKYSILFFVIHKKQIQFTLKIVHLSVGKFTCQNIKLTN